MKIIYQEYETVVRFSRHNEQNVGEPLLQLGASLAVHSYNELL